MLNSSRQIKLGAIISYLALGINMLASLIYLPWMVSMIGKSNYALYTLATSFIALFVLDFGLSSAVTRFVAKYNAEGRQDLVNEVVSTIARLYFVIDAVFFVVLFTLYFFIEKVYAGLTADEILIFKQLYIIVAINSLISFPFLPLSGILNAYELFIQQKSAELFQKMFSIVLIVIILLNGGDVRALVIANVVSAVFTIIIKLFFVKRHTPIGLKIKTFNKNIFSEVAKFSIWVTVISLAQRCIFNLAPSIIGIVSNSTEIALFAPANALEGYFFTVSAAVNGLFLATVSRYEANKENEKISSLMVRVGRYQFILLGLIFVEFFCIGRDFMICWMGADFIKSWSCALILFIPDILLFSQQIANTAVIAKNKVKQQAVGYIIMVVVCLAASFVLSRPLGAIGACFSIAMGYFVLFVYMNVLYHRQMNINVFAFFKECYFKLSLPMLAVAAIGYYVCTYLIALNGWFGVLTKGMIVLVSFVGTMCFFINKEEKQLIKRLFSRGRH